MATLIKYSNFKSMKQSSAKAKKTSNAKKNGDAEMSAFLRLLSNSKAKKA